MYGKMLEIENAVFPENMVFSQKKASCVFVGMTCSSVFEAPGMCNLLRCLKQVPAHVVSLTCDALKAQEHQLLRTGNVLLRSWHRLK